MRRLVITSSARRWKTYKSRFSEVSSTQESLSGFLGRRIEGYVRGGSGSKVAVGCAVSGRAITYGEFLPRVEAAASALQAQGFGPGDTLLIHSPNCPEYPIAFQAALRLGGVVSTSNPLYTARELAHQIKDSKAKHVLTIGMFADTAREAAGDEEASMVSVLGEAGCPVAVAGTPYDENARAEEHGVGGDRIAALPYSSGTTGLPKGVMLSHANLATNLLQVEQSYREGDVGADVTDSERASTDTLLGLLPMFHIYGMNTVLNYALAQGATLLSLPKFDPETFVAALKRPDGPTIAHLVPPLLLFLSHHEPFETPLKIICSGAAPLDAALQTKVADSLDVRVFQGYGLTESSPVTHCDLAGKPGSVGQLASSTEARVVRERRPDEPGDDPYVDVAPGEQGELLTRGPQIMKGYLNRDVETAQTLLPGGWLRTGDLAVVEEVDSDPATFWVVDRVKELIKVKGLQVSPAEIEGLLLQHDRVKDAAVVPQPDARSGELPHAFLSLDLQAPFCRPHHLRRRDPQVGLRQNPPPPP
ncbi:hypothetical protein CTAYLR_001658 [Chrysophaeum taylorii]|uniref:Uncharacterized protein n=1 Tax=Chrysophaeum taylorii TaxID=2483200 RepID=A0AAD7UDS6_9STRA|nr:hypothetical protein CTAYLR_001658 [Chrysophaeum taylorii]